MEVTENIYARDNGNVTGGSFNSGNAYEIGNYFDIFADQTIYSINVGIHTACEAGAIMYATIYSIDAATGDFIFEGNTDDYTVDASDIDAEVTYAKTLLAVNNQEMLSALLPNTPGKPINKIQNFRFVRSQE